MHGPHAPLSLPPQFVRRELRAYARTIAAAIPQRHTLAHGAAAAALAEVESLCEGVGGAPLSSRLLREWAWLAALLVLHVFPAAFLGARWWHSGRLGVDFVAPDGETGPLAGQAWRVAFWASALLSLLALLLRPWLAAAWNDGTADTEAQEAQEADGTEAEVATHIASATSALAGLRKPDPAAGSGEAQAGRPMPSPIRAQDTGSGPTTVTS